VRRLNAEFREREEAASGRHDGAEEA
jgi:hypothetical protein